MAPFGQIIGLRQVISEELQNKYDDQFSGKSVFEEFLFHIGFLLLLIGQHQCHMDHDHMLHGTCRIENFTAQ